MQWFAVNDTRRAKTVLRCDRAGQRAPRWLVVISECDYVGREHRREGDNP